MDVLGLPAETLHPLLSPTRAFLVVTLTILTAEIISILFGGRLVTTSGLLHETMDITIILTLTLPSLYLFFARPMTRAIQGKAAAERSLRRMCLALDGEVRSRTARLEDLNQSLRQSEALYSHVVECSPTGICILQDGCLVFGNMEFIEIAGLFKDNQKDCEFISLIHPDDLPALRLIWSKANLGNPSAGDCDFRITLDAGTVRWIRGRFIPIQFQGRPALLGNVQDITERHQVERNLKESREALRLLSARLFTIQEEERKRVAQDLHDEVGQSLTAIKFIVERALEGRCTESQHCRRDVLQSAIPVIQKTVEEIRRICMALRPSTLDDLGLIATLRWFIREFQSTYPLIRTELIIDFEESGIPETLKTSIFRIVQEAMNNVAKHAKAGCLTVSLRPGPGDLRLTIRDNGAGFDPWKQRVRSKRGGFGLASMRERAQYYDGTLVVESAPAKGTEVIAMWPLVESPDFEQEFYSQGPR
jgi:PAS domain S-box-containing protein